MKKTQKKKLSLFVGCKWLLDLSDLQLLGALLSRKKMIWAFFGPNSKRARLQMLKFQRWVPGTRHTNNESFLIKCAQSVGPWDGMKTQQITSTKQKDVHPGKLTWNLKITCFRRKTIFQTFIVRFHVNFQGCKKPWLESGIDFFSAPSFFAKVIIESLEKEGPGKHKKVDAIRNATHLGYENSPKPSFFQKSGSLHLSFPHHWIWFHNDWQDSTCFQTCGPRLVALLYEVT